MNSQKHGLRIYFHGAAGTVTGSSTVVKITNGSSNNVQNILVDSGSTLAEGTSSSVRSKIDAILYTHSHADHLGEAAPVITRNPDIPVYIPAGSKRVNTAMVIDAQKFRAKSQELDMVQHSEWQMYGWLSEVAKSEKQLPQIGTRKQFKQNRRGRKNKTMSVSERADMYADIEKQIDGYKGLIETKLGNYYPEEYTPKGIANAIKEWREAKNKELRERGDITNDDVMSAINRMEEKTLGKLHEVFPKNKIDQRVQFMMKETGHLNTAPATQVLLRARGKNILFSGDRGNNNLPTPYAKPDDEGLSNKADFLILESTYGGREHIIRENELQKMDKIIIDAIKNKEDIIIPTISLDRPLVVFYEIITRLIDTGIIDPKEVDILYFGNLLEKLLHLVPKDNPMWRKIKGHIKPLQKDSLKSLQNPGKKTRIILAGGGFLPTDGSPAGAALENALEQEKLTIIFPNYHGGPNSNAGNLIARRPFFLTRDNQEPHELKTGHKAHYISGFSGHADTPQLVDYAARVTREGATIFLNHGTDQARLALKNALENDPRIQAKNIIVVIPKQGKDYVLKSRR